MTKSDDTRPWFLVFFQRPYTINRLRLYMQHQVGGGDNEKQRNRKRMAGIHELVDSTECHYWGSYSDNGNIPTPANWKYWDYFCTTPRPPTGRYLRLQKDLRPSGYGDYGILGFCEIQVWVCGSGLYGDAESGCQACQSPCPYICDNYNGCLTKGVEFADFPNHWRTGLHNICMMRPAINPLNYKYFDFGFPRERATDGRILDRDYWNMASLWPMPKQMAYVRVELEGLYMVLGAALTAAVDYELFHQKLEVRIVRSISNFEQRNKPAGVPGDQLCWEADADGSVTIL
jgi:hypothetical protein